jgi:large subunit ribosomal protein L10
LSLNLESKKTVVAEINKILQGAATIVIAQYQGVTVDQLTTIRKEARKSNVYLHVLKNTLARRAVSGTKFEPLADKMVGPLIYGISGDPVAAAKVVNDFAKANSTVKLVGGMFNDKLLDVASVKQLAATPGREQLLAMLLGTMQQIPASFARVIAAIRDKKEQAA